MPTPDPRKKRFPEVADLPVINGLPDPLMFADGSRLTSPAQWDKRREEIKALFEQYVYGHMPPPPGRVEAEELPSQTIFGGKTIQRMVRLRFGPGKKLSVNLSLVHPRDTSVRRPRPVVLYLFRGNTLPEGGLWPDCDLPAERGFIGVSFGNGDCIGDEVDHTHGFLPHYPDHDWATLASWAWTMSRVVDWLVQQDFVDADKIAVTGHSRRGKACLLAAAFDERIALAAPSGSGCGGVGLSRAAEVTPGAETIRDITTRFPYWFHPRLAAFAGAVDRLPVDQHMLLALVAPRPVMTCEGLADLWANPRGTQQSLLAAAKVYEFLGAGGIGDSVGMRFRAGGHDLTRADWTAILDFCDMHLMGRKVKRPFGKLPFPQSAR